MKCLIVLGNPRELPTKKNVIFTNIMSISSGSQIDSIIIKNKG